MNFAEWTKERKRGSNGGTDTASKTGRIKASSFAEWTTLKKPTKSVVDWVEAGNALQEEIQKHYETWQEDDGYYRNRVNDLIMLASQWRKQYAGNEEVIQDIDSVVSSLGKLSGYVRRYDDYYGKFDSREDYEFALERSKQFYDAWGHYLDAEDFEKYAAQGAAIENPTMTDAESDGRFLWWSWEGEEIGNIVTYSRENANELAVAAANNATTQGNYKYRSMTEEEVDIYNYLLAKEGKEKANEFLTFLEEDLNAREGGALAERLQGIDIPVLEEIALGAYGLGAGVDQWAGGVKRFFTNEDLPTSATQYANANISDSLEGFWKYAYGATNVIGNMAPSIGLSYLTGSKEVGAASMGISAAGNAYGNALEAGHDVGQARWYSTMVGLAEGGLQYALGGIASMGGLTDDAIKATLDMIDNSLLRVSAKLGADLLSEVAEEELQNYLEPVFRSIFLGEEYSAPELDELIETAILTAITTPIMGGGQTVGKDIATGRYYKDNYGASAQELVAEGLAGPENSLSNRLATKYQSRLDAGKNLSGHQLGRMVQANEQQIRSEDMASIQRGAQTRLSELGETGDTAAVAGVLAKQAAGEKLSKADKALLSGSRYARRVANELDPENIRDETHSSGWAQKLDTNRIHPKAYSSLVEDGETDSQGGKTTNSAKMAVNVDDSETVLKSTGEGVRIRGIAGIKKGRMTLVLEDDRTVDAADVVFGSKAEALVYEAVSRLEGIIDADTADKLARHLLKLGNADSDVYVNGIVQAYTYGYYGYGRQAMIRENTLSSTLTEAQRNVAYGRGQMYRDAKTAADQQKAQSGDGRKVTSANGKPSTAAPDGTRYKKVRFEGRITKWGKKQKAEVAFVDFIAASFSGNTVHVFESYKNSDGKYVYEDSNGKVHMAPNGKYIAGNGDIYLDLNAGNRGEGLVLNTFAHELYHHIKKYSPEKARALAEFLVRELGYDNVDAAVRRQIEKAKASGHGVDWLMKTYRLSRNAAERRLYDRAFDDFVADSLETMFTRGDVMEKLQKLKQQDAGLVGMIKRFIDKWVKKLRQFYNGHNALSIEGELVSHLEKFEQIQQMFAEALVDAGENYQTGGVQKNATEDGDTNYSLNPESLQPDAEGVVVNQDGEPVAYATGDGTAEFSLRTYEEDGRSELRKYLHKCVQSERITQAEMQEMVDGIEEIYQICKEFKDKYAPFSTWSDAAVVRDTHGRPVFSVVTPNGEYKMNLDFSLVCKKRRTLDAVLNEMSARGIIDDFELGQKSVVRINEIIRKCGLETACALCFVDAKRFRQASMADSFTSLYNELVESLVPESEKNRIDHFNFAGYATIGKVDDGIHTWDASRLDFSHINHVLKTYGSGTVEYKAAEYIKSHAEGRRLLLRGDFMSSKGFDAVKARNGDILKLYNSKNGTGGPKAAFGDVQYMNEVVRKARWWTPAKAYAVGGVRVQSFSDYVPRMVFDYVQMVYDLAATKLPAHAYTKEALFVKQFGLTGIKINMSLIPAIAEGGIAPGLDANGNYVWAGESFDFETAKQIQNAPGYTENCGTVCVGVSYQHILKLLGDPDIRMVIPYHKSGLNPIVAHMNKIAEFTDYTTLKTNPGGCQNTMDKNGNKVEEDFNFNKVLRETGDPKAAVRQYLSWCAQNEYTPRFAEFAWHENYYKLIEDFTLYDKDGNYAPQREVRAVFPKEGSAFGSMKELIRQGLQEDAIIEGRRDKNLSAIVDEIQRTLPRTEAEIAESQVEQADRDLEEDAQHSERDYSYEALIGKPDMVVVAVGGTFPTNRADVLAQAKKNAASVGRSDPKTGSVSVRVKDIDADVLLGKDGLKHSLDRRFSVNAPIVIKAGEIISNSICINELTPQKAEAAESYVLIGAARNESGEIYVVRSVVNRFSSELTSMDVLYAINAKKEPAALLPLSAGKPALGTDSTVSIARLLDYVNQYFPDILPEDVLRHYGHSSRPKGKLGADALYSDRDIESVSNRSLLANALEGVAQNEVEKQKLQEYKEKIDLLDEQERKLGELNQQIRELSFAKGPRDMDQIRRLRDEAQKTANRIDIYDNQLLRLEASKPLQNVLQRRRKAAYQRAEQKGKAALRAETKKHREDQRIWETEFNRILREYEAAGRNVDRLQEKIVQQKQAAKEKVAQVRETAQKREARGKLQKLVLDTANWLAHPSKTDVKCPDMLKKPYADFLNSIDMSSERLAKGGDPTKKDLRLANAMDSLATALERIVSAQDPTQETTAVLDTGYLDLPANYIQKLRDMTEQIKEMMVEGEYVVNTMSAEEVRKLSQMIRTLNHAIKKVSTLYANLRFANVEELGNSTMTFVGGLGEIQKTGGLKDFIQWENALPYYAFKRFGAGGESVFEGLMDAQDKLAFLAQDIFAFQEKTWTGKEAKEWSEDVHTIDLPDGTKLTLTTADAMSIYCLSRRQQGIKHLLGGGVRVLGLRKGSKKTADSRSKLTIKDIDAIVSSLSDRQKEVAEAIQEFMSTTCSEWGNEISMKRFLTREFTERFYFPIESNDENLSTKDPAAQQSDLFRLLNISATKPIDPRANNEVIIRNVFDVFTGHASDMARLNAYGMALLDYMKWLNYRVKTVNGLGQIDVKGVRKSMEKAYGNGAISYVLNLIKDVNGRPSDNGDPGIYMKWMRAAKTASVGNSLRVATLQVTSYPRAALVLSPRSLVLGLSKRPSIEKAKKYCGIALWKSFGFYDTNISRSIEEQMKGVKSVKQKLIELSLKGAEIGDALTWGALWNACEYEVAATKQFEVGSEEFNQAVGKKLREVVYRTQVVDSTLTRSQIMRSKRGMAQEAAAFMSEPTLSANILMDAGFRFHAQKRRTGSAKEAWSQTGKYVGKAVAVYSVGQLTAALLESLWDAWRDDEDEKFGEKFSGAFVENLALDLVPFNKIPIVSNAFEAALAVFDLGYFSSDKLSTTWLAQSVSAAGAWRDVLSGESSATVYNALYKTVRATSSYVGVSFSGAMREAVALWNNTAGAADPTLKVLTYERSDAKMGKLLLDALIEGDDRQVDSVCRAFENEKDRYSALRTAIKDRFEAGEIDEDTAMEYLVDYGGMDEDEAFWRMEEWAYDKESDEEFKKYNEFYGAVQSGKNLKKVIAKYTDNGVEKKTLASQITAHFKPLYREMSKSERAAIKGYLLNAYELLGYDRARKSKDIDRWLEN